MSDQAEQPRWQGHATHHPHGSGLRGLSEGAGAGDIYTPRFGPMFPGLPAAYFEEEDLKVLAQAMQANSGGDGEGEAEEEGPDPEEGHIPAAYTYFGQFVDHDLTFDPSTFSQAAADPSGRMNLRSARFDLDCLYGRGPGDQPYLYDEVRMQLGEKLVTVTRNPHACDLPRAKMNAGGVSHAIIGDPRNDENVIVSQLQGMLLRFHNRIADENASAPFSEIRRAVLWHYQWIVVRDFLPRLVHRDVLKKISPALIDSTLSFVDFPPALRHYKPYSPDIPDEFSVAAYRLGHSMVRSQYRVNEFTGPLPIFDPENPTGGLNAFGEFPRSWAIDWQRFIDLGIAQEVSNTDRIQLAYKIDTSMVEPLFHLPKSVAGDESVQVPALASLAFRNLKRGVLRGLPTGQDVAKYLGETPLSDKEILFGAAKNDAPDEEANSISMAVLAPHLVEQCPLWIYILAESRHNFFTHGLAQLGPVGGTIVAETLLGILARDPDSFLNVEPTWRPALGQDGHFTLSDLLRYALGR